MMTRLISDIHYIYIIKFYYENMPMQCTEIFQVEVVKMIIFSRNFSIFFLFLLKT